MLSKLNNIDLSKCCELITLPEFLIRDIKNSHCIISDESNFHLKVKNPDLKSINFLKIDKCFFNDSDKLRKCDCSLNTESEIYFIEIKELENAFELTNKQDHIKRKNIRKEAKKQLIVTINRFKKLGLTDLKNTKAIISLVPRLNPNYTKLISIKEQSVIDDFMTKTGCPNIYEGNLIEF